jgi:hypothetical protein
MILIISTNIQLAIVIGLRDAFRNGEEAVCDEKDEKAEFFHE